MPQAVTDFLKSRPFIAAVLAVPVVLITTQLALLVGGEDASTTAREETLLVIVFGILVLIACVLPTIGTKKLWKILSGGTFAAAFAVYLVASALAKSDATVDEISATQDVATGALNVSVNARDLRGNQRLAVRARWGDRDHARTVGHKKGLATDKFPVASVAKPTKLRIVAYVTRVKGAGEQPTGLTCRDYDACADYSTTIGTPPPDLSATVKERALTISVPQNPAAPDRLVVVVFLDDDEVFKDNPLITARAYETSVRLRPAKSGGADRVCVLATYDVDSIDGCKPALGVSRKVFSLAE